MLTKFQQFTPGLLQKAKNLPRTGKQKLMPFIERLTFAWRFFLYTILLRALPTCSRRRGIGCFLSCSSRFLETFEFPLTANKYSIFPGAGRRETQKDSDPGKDVEHARKCREKQVWLGDGFRTRRQTEKTSALPHSEAVSSLIEKLGIGKRWNRLQRFPHG